jgi:hypothetical protein
MTQQPFAADEAAPWVRLWKTGVLHSCAVGIQGNYDGEIRDFWHQRFAGLGDGQVLVDVGTGNGAIPLLAKQFAQRQGMALHIHGVDLAAIDPPRDVPGGVHCYEGIRFHPRTSMTSMPFSDGEVSLLCSQFAFEYAPHAEAAKEILRVVGHSGAAALIVHSTDSLIATVGRAQLQACRWLLGESPILRAAADLAMIMAGADTPPKRAALASDSAAEAARHRFNEAASALMDRIEAQPSAALLQQTAQRLAGVLARPAATRDEAAASLSGLRDWIEDEERRLALMHAAALDGPALEQVARLLGAGGWPVRTGRLLYGGSTCVGWTIVVGHV